jgi:hypothetical protein
MTGPVLPEPPWMDPTFVEPHSFWVAAALDAIKEMEQKPAPDAEPVPHKPTPNQPDGPAIPQPRNDGSIRGRALARFAELGAPAWVIAGFDCIGWKESGWNSIRSRYMNSNGTYDHGPLQFNDVHWPRLNRYGLDPYVPEHAAEFAWIIFQEQGFNPWRATRAGCG